MEMEKKYDPEESTMKICNYPEDEEGSESEFSDEDAEDTILDKALFFGLIALTSLTFISIELLKRYKRR